MSASTTAPSGYTVQRVVSLAMETLESLRTEHGQVIETDEEVADALISEGIDIDTLLRRLTRAALDAKANAEAAKSRIEDLATRRDRFLRQNETYRATILAVMEAIGSRKFVDPEFSLGISAGRPKVIVTDETKLRDDLVTIVTTRTPNKSAILAALSANQDVDGAILSNGSQTLTIRSK